MFYFHILYALYFHMIKLCFVFLYALWAITIACTNRKLLISVDDSKAFVLNKRLSCECIQTRVNNRGGEYLTQYKVSTNDLVWFKGILLNVLRSAYGQDKELWYWNVMIAYWKNNEMWWLKKSSHSESTANHRVLQRNPFESSLIICRDFALLLLTLDSIYIDIMNSCSYSCYWNIYLLVRICSLVTGSNILLRYYEY